MVHLRPATQDDWARLFSWRNDPETRARFTSGEVVTYAEHKAWLDRTLRSREVVLYVAQDDQTGFFVGTLRLDHDPKRKAALVSITVEPRLRGQGFGSRILGAMWGIPVKWKATKALAEVKADNYASLRAFAENGFKPVSSTQAAVILERKL